MWSSNGKARRPSSHPFIFIPILSDCVGCHGAIDCVCGSNFFPRICFPFLPHYKFCSFSFPLSLVSALFCSFTQVSLPVCSFISSQLHFSFMGFFSHRVLSFEIFCYHSSLYFDLYICWSLYLCGACDLILTFFSFELSLVYKILIIWIIKLWSCHFNLTSIHLWFVTWKNKFPKLGASILNCRCLWFGDELSSNSWVQFIRSYYLI